jgi:hypothetical protein
MKTKKLIELLQQADPSGEMEVTVGKSDIHFIHQLPAYWDGCYSVLTRDETNEECYNITGAEYKSKGAHICIEKLSVKDMIMNDTDALVTYESEYAESCYKDNVEYWRTEFKKIEDEVKAKSK